MNTKKAFLNSQQPHVLMITNHGIHQWKIIPGLPDTGGQNVFVNQFSMALAAKDFKITIVNRGGFPHPTTGEMREGVIYKNENQRILFLNDGLAAFVRKEDMDDRMPDLVDALRRYFDSEGCEPDIIISHYWDGAELGRLFNASLPKAIRHIWVPHSLGAVKKRNVDKSQWKKLRIDERIEKEKKILAEVDSVAATSAIIRASLHEDYGYESTPLFLPPCIDSDRYHPRKLTTEDPIWTFLAKHTQVSVNIMSNSRIITEISRTDTTKRKDVLIKAFAKVHKRFPETTLVITIDKNNKELSENLCGLIHSLGIEKSTVVLGSVWNELPEIYAVTDIYCTPSVMEGFGMTPQEAAATKVPVVSSDMVPFVMEYLLGDEVEKVPYGVDQQKLKIGKGAIVAPADDVDGFVAALEILLSNDTLRKEMGESAYALTIPYFTWDNMVRVFLVDGEIEATPAGGNE